MGMGEPAHNLDHVLEAIDLLGTEGDLATKNLVFSTVGDRRVFERLPRSAVKPALALSLHTTKADLRAQLLPRAPRIDPDELVALADEYSQLTKYPTQYQWTLLEGVNDGDDELESIAALARRQVRRHELHPVQRSAGLGVSSPDLGARYGDGALPAPPRRAHQAAPLRGAGRRSRLRPATGASAGMTTLRSASAALTAVLAGAAMLATTPIAHADTLTLVNALRKQGCGRSPPAPAVQANRTLDTAARELARSGKLRESVEGAGYSAAKSVSLHIKGPTSDDDIRRRLAANSCASLVDGEFTELGAYRRADETWIVLAKPLPKPPVLEPAAQAARVLELVNAARTEARTCDRQTFAPASALKPSALLASAAAAHARDMAEHAELTHTGSDGSKPADRITRAGYEWRASGENVAAGQRDADAVVAAWLKSPGHCANIMEPNFTEMGVAFVQVPGANPNIYWAQSFATPR